MTGTVAELLVRLSADNSALMRGLNDAERATTGFGSRFGRIMSGVGRYGTMAFGAIATAGVAVVGTGLKIAADMEQARVAFETMLGSGEKADAFLKQLQDFAAQTPFEFPQLQEAAKKLMAVGTNADDVIPIMTTLGNATAAMGTGAEGIQRATLALAQMQQKGKVTGEEMMQLTEAGVPAWDALATAIGVSVPEAMDMVSKGMVAPEALFDAIKNGAGETLGALDGMMAKQSQTLSGLFSTLKDTVMMNLADAAKPLADALKPVIPELSKSLGTLVGTLGKAFGPVLAEIANVLAGLLPVLAPIVETIGVSLADALKAVGPAIPVVTEAIGNIIAAFAPFLPVLAEVIGVVAEFAGTLINELMPAVQPLIDAMLPPLRDLVEALAPHFQDLIPPLLTIAESFITLLVALTPLIDPLTRLMVLTVDIAAQLIAQFAPGIQVAADAIAGIIGWVSRAVDWFVGFIETVMGMPEKVQSAWTAIKEAIINAFKSAINFVIGAWNKLDFTIDVTLPDVPLVPGLDGQRIYIPDLFPDIPMLAKGGIVTRPTLAMVGEAGPEAIIPLSGGRGMTGSALDLAVDVRIDRKAWLRDSDYFARVRGL